MKCYKHPDRQGTGECVICGKILCDECQIHLGDQVVCKSCVASLIPENEQKAINEAVIKHDEKTKPKKSLFGFLKREKSEKPKEKSEPKTQANVNQYPYGEVNNPYSEEVIHEETYEYWDEDETPQKAAYPDQSSLFEPAYATKAEKPKSRPSIFRRHKMEKPEKKSNTGFEGYVAPEEIVIDHSDDEPSQLETLFIPEEDEFRYDYTYKEDPKDEFKTQTKEPDTPKAIVIDHTDDENSQIKDYNPQYEEPALKKEMENIIDRSNEISMEEELAKAKAEAELKAQNEPKLSKEEIEELIYNLHKEGNSPSKIGIILRDQYNVPNIKAATGQKLTKIIKNKEELENKEQPDLENDEMSIASAGASAVINTTEEEIARPSLKPFDDINGPQVFDYEHGALIEETENEKEESSETPKVEIPTKEEEKGEDKEIPTDDEVDTGEIIIEKTPEELELLKKIQNEKEEPKEEKTPIQTQEIPKPKSTTTASSKVENMPPIDPRAKQISPKNSISMQNIMDSSMFVKSYVDNYSMLPSSVRINHKKWNMAEFLYYAVTSVTNISEGIFEPIPHKSIMDVINTKDDFKFGTITKDDYVLLSKIIQIYIDSEGRAPFDRQSTIGILQFRTLVYMFASILTTYKFINQLPETYLVNDNVFKTEDDVYTEENQPQQSKQVIPPITTSQSVSAAEPVTPPIEQTTIPEPEIPIEPAETVNTPQNTPKNLIDELQKNIQDYKNEKQNTDAGTPISNVEQVTQEPRIDNGIERTSIPTPEPVEPEIEPTIEDNIITPKKEDNPSVSNIKRLMQNSSKSSQGDDEILEAEQTIEDLKKTKDDGVGDLKENYIDNRTRELQEDPHKLTRSSQSPMPKPKEVIRGKKELIRDDLKYTPNDEKIRSSLEEIEDEYYYEDETEEQSDLLIFLISFIIFLVVFGIVAYVIYVNYFQATFGEPGEIISNLFKLI